MLDPKKRLEDLRRQRCEMCGLKVEKRMINDREGRPIYTLDSGGPGRPVLFVHGGGSDLGEWIELAAEVRKTGRRVVLADRPGHGLSYRIEYGGFDFREAAADWCEDVFESISGTKVDIVANSLGAYFSSVFALRRPEAIYEMVFLGAPAGLHRHLPYQLRLMGLSPVNRALFRQARHWNEEDYRDMFGSLLVVDADRLPDEVVEYTVAMAEVPGYEVAWRSLLEECTTLIGFKHMIRDEFVDLDMPIHMIWGAQDAFAPPIEGIKLLDKMPRAAVSVVEHAGHLPWFDRFEYCAKLVVETLEPGAEASPAGVA